MSGNRKRSAKHHQVQSQAEEWPKKMKLSQARKFLGISFSTLSILVGSGKIKVEEDPLDRRVRLVKRRDLEKLLHQRTRV
jgi:predicted site-specific integrase-resolvase